MVERVDPEAKKLVHYDETEVEYDLLVTVPLNKGDEIIARSGLGDELNYVPVDKHTFLSNAHPNIFVLGDAAALPTSKAGSVAHFAVDCFAENFLRYIDGLEMLPSFDGHANCFIESGFGKGLLIDFNYDVEPLPGRYPLPGSRALYVVAGVRDEPLGQDDVPVDVLEHLVERPGTAVARAHEHVGQVAQVREAGWTR